MTVASPVDAAASFEEHRRRLTGLAYRMLGSLAEAEDVVQEAYLRWHAADRAGVENPRAFLSTVVTRLCLDHLKSARVQRESYVGPWLPEPVVDVAGLAAETASDGAHDLSVALMLVLERLTPLERAAFLLHDVFDVGFVEIAPVLGRSEAACRQLAARARSHVRAARPRFPASLDEGARLADAFRAAAANGDAAALARLLADDAVLYTDGGGKRPAALNPIRGADKITRFLEGIARKADNVSGWRFRPLRLNGQPGFILAAPDGTMQTIGFDIRDGRITAIYVVLNPDKLRRVAL
jgi:RNA polymerase sigma-70 factor (ECF subfamily)